MRFRMPGGPPVEARATLRFDPGRPEQGSEVLLLGLTAEAVASIEAYIEERTSP